MSVTLNKKAPSELSVGNLFRGDKTLFGRKWLFFAVDEAHKIRTLNQSFAGVSALRRQSEFTMAVTATPITTSAKVRVLLRLIIIHLTSLSIGHL